VATSEQSNRWPHIRQLFLQQGRLTAEELESALAQQRESGGPLGEILVAREHISRVDLAGALSRQWTWQGEEPEADDTPVEQPGAAERHETTPSVEEVAALTQRVAALEDGGSLVADLQARLKAGYAQLTADEARVEALEEQVSDLTKAFGVLQRYLHARTEEVEALRVASLNQETQAATQALPLG
jgi:hypothetical protein